MSIGPVTCLVMPQERIVQRVDVKTGLLTTVAGNGRVGFSGDNGPATSAELAGAKSIAVDSDGNLYIADHNRIRKVSNGRDHHRGRRRTAIRHRRGLRRKHIHRRLYFRYRLARDAKQPDSSIDSLPMMQLYFREGNLDRNRDGLRAVPEMEAS